MLKPKKIPMRMCVGCHEMKPKKELTRIVRSPEGEVSLDPTGKKSGRGAYLCGDINCLKKARKTRALERKFEAGEVVDGASLKAKGITKKENELVKVLGDGELTKALIVRVDKVSANAKAKIEAAGGKVEEPC